MNKNKDSHKNKSQWMTSNQAMLTKILDTFEKDNVDHAKVVFHSRIVMCCWSPAPSSSAPQHTHRVEYLEKQHIQQGPYNLENGILSYPKKTWLLYIFYPLALQVTQDSTSQYYIIFLS